MFFSLIEIRVKFYLDLEYAVFYSLHYATKCTTLNYTWYILILVQDS